jgi:hypothetical protein
VCAADAAVVVCAADAAGTAVVCAVVCAEVYAEVYVEACAVADGKEEESVDQNANQLCWISAANHGIDDENYFPTASHRSSSLDRKNLAFLSYILI